MRVQQCVRFARFARSLSIIPKLYSNACDYLYSLHTSTLTVKFPMMRNVRYQTIFNGLKFTLHNVRVLINVVKTTITDNVEMFEKFDVRVGKRSIERVRYVINNLNCSSQLLLMIY